MELSGQLQVPDSFKFPCTHFIGGCVYRSNGLDLMNYSSFDVHTVA